MIRPCSKVLKEILENEGYEATTAPTGESGLRCLKEQTFDLVLSDLALPGLDGMELLKYLRREQPACPCIIITGFGTIANAVSAMHQGAYDYSHQTRRSRRTPAGGGPGPGTSASEMGKSAPQATAAPATASPIW